MKTWTGFSLSPVRRFPNVLFLRRPSTSDHIKPPVISYCGVARRRLRWMAETIRRRPAGFVSATQLTAQVPGSDITAVGTATVTVANLDGQTSNSAAFTITAPQHPNTSCV